MKGYAATDVFTARELQLLEKATKLVAAVSDDTAYVAAGELIRCHELARAVGDVLHLPVVDGKFGSVEHSWLLTTLPNSAKRTAGFVPRPSILDVYSVGRLPMVQLVDNVHWGLTAHKAYVEGEFRKDINTGVVERLLCQMKG
jgi:hypothetical protein